ncbi:MAG: FAD-dependent oxidoreductase [Planctomycetales bacterium]
MPEGKTVRIAIVGSGISGLTAAYHLADRHEITVFEGNGYIGGHTNTVEVEIGAERHAIDTGFIVFNDWTYPNFVRLLDDLGVASRPTSMGFSVRCDASGWEYSGNSLNSLFSQRRNLLRPRFWRMLADILRFNRNGGRLLEEIPEDLTVSEFLRKEKYSREFGECYLKPMGSAIWSCPLTKFGDFPVKFILEFYKNHGLLSVWKRPTWRVIEGGSRSYVTALTAKFRDRIRLRTPVAGVRRTEEGVLIVLTNGEVEKFDHVVMACHSDQALRRLEDATPTEREVLGCFPYERNVAVLHTDESLLPRNRRAWSSWNYHVRGDSTERATVTYCMNILQQIESRQTFCVTLNEEEGIDPAKVLRRFEYHHPVFTTKRSAAQRRHRELLNVNRTSFCGAYWGNGFHEDGVVSGLAVVRALEGAHPATTIETRKQPEMTCQPERCGANGSVGA